MKLKDKLKSPFLQGSAISFVMQILGVGLALLVQIVLTRNLNANDYGIYTYIISFITLLSTVTTFGFATSIIRYIPEYSLSKDYGLINGVILGSIGITTFICLLIFIGVEVFQGESNIISNFLGVDDSVFLYALICLLLFSLLKLFSSIERGKKNMFRTHLSYYIIRHLIIIISIWFFLSSRQSIGVTEAILSTLIAYATGVGIHMIFLNSNLGFTIFRTKPIFRIPEWAKVSSSLLLISGFSTLLNQTDIIMLGFFEPKDKVGIYNIALKIASLTSFVLLAVNAIAAPTISKLYHSNKLDELKRFAKLNANIVFWPTLVLACVIILFADTILSLFGTVYTDGKTILYILLFGQLINALVGSVAYYLNMTGYEKDSFRVFGTTAVINVVLNPICIHLYGAEGAAIATAISMAIWNIWLYFLVKKRLGISSSII